MNPEIKKKWVEALRSGKFKQGKGALYKSTSGYCCLGVLCKVMGYKFVPSKNFFSMSKISCDTEGEMVTILSDEIYQKAGLDTNKGSRVFINDEYLYLTEHNDHGKTFEEIADAIEEQL